MSEIQKQRVYDLAEIYVPLGIAVIGAAITWGVFSTRLTQAETNISTLQTTQMQTATALNAIQVQVGEIDTSVEFIEKQYKN